MSDNIGVLIAIKTIDCIVVIRSSSNRGVIREKDAAAAVATELLLLLMLLMMLRVDMHIGLRAICTGRHRPIDGVDVKMACVISTARPCCL